MSMHPFDEKAWEERLVSSLDVLRSTQKPFLEAYWQGNGFPTQITFNGRDETPFPSFDLFDLYESARHAERFGNMEYYKPLRASLDPVRGVLHSHPGLAGALGRVIGNDDVQVGILNGSSWTCLTHLIVGQMARRKVSSEKCFDGAVTELNSLLQLSRRKRSSPLPNDLDLGFDIALFHGAHIQNVVDLGEGYSLMPYSQLSEYIDNKWLEDLAPDQIRHRNFKSICAIVHPFRWKPEIRDKNSMGNQKIKRLPFLFERWVIEFANLLSVSLETPVVWMMTLEGCVSRTTCELLGQTHSPSSTHRGRSVNHLFDPFRKEQVSDEPLIEEARRHFINRRETAYAELAPIIQRLAEALCRDGRYAAQDRVLDLALALERLLKPSSKRISLELQETVSDMLGADDETKARLKKEVKHFYDVRSAIIHGPIDEKKKHLLTELGEAFRNGFDITRASLMKMLE